MRVEPVELLVHVEPLREQYHLLLEAHRIELIDLGKALTQPVLIPSRI